jgi:predicted lipoprotein with Yx(FWY)xxD motif
MSSTVNVAMDASGGEYVVATNGMSLYLFTPDTDDTSTCKDTCASNWPPYTVADEVSVTAGAGVTGTVGTIKRDDGSTQVTINKQPLYFFAGDKAAGDVNGQGVNEVWYLVKPSGEQVAGGGKGAY